MLTPEINSTPETNPKSCTKHPLLKNAYDQWVPNSDLPSHCRECTKERQKKSREQKKRKVGQGSVMV